jgi:hypothetical protein
MTSSAPSAQVSPARRVLRATIWQSVGALGVTVLLVIAVDAGGRILGPALILIGAFWGAKALREWWRHLDEEWFAAEVLLVCMGWALLAGAFAAVQYVAFSVVPDAFYVDVDYARLVAPAYRAVWARDSARTAGALADVERAAEALGVGGPPSLMLDSLYPLAAGASGRLTERCEVKLPLEACPWKLVIVPAPGAAPIEVAIAGPEEEGSSLAAAELQEQLRREVARLRSELAENVRRMVDPAAFVQPRLVDFLYDTVVAFSGNDAGVFIPISALARLCKVIEFLVSLLLFGIVVSRIAAAADARATRS